MTCSFLGGSVGLGFGLDFFSWFLLLLCFGVLFVCFFVGVLSGFCLFSFAFCGGREQIRLLISGILRGKNICICTLKFRPTMQNVFLCDTKLMNKHISAWQSGGCIQCSCKFKQHNWHEENIHWALKHQRTTLFNISQSSGEGTTWRAGCLPVANEHRRNRQTTDP